MIKIQWWCFTAPAKADKGDLTKVAFGRGWALLWIRFIHASFFNQPWIPWAPWWCIGIGRNRIFHGSNKWNSWRSNIPNPNCLQSCFPVSTLIQLTISESGTNAINHHPAEIFQQIVPASELGHNSSTGKWPQSIQAPTLPPWHLPFQKKTKSLRKKQGRSNIPSSPKHPDNPSSKVERGNPKFNFQLCGVGKISVQPSPSAVFPCLWNASRPEISKGSNTNAIFFNWEKISEIYT